MTFISFNQAANWLCCFRQYLPLQRTLRLFFKLAKIREKSSRKLVYHLVVVRVPLPYLAYFLIFYGISENRDSLTWYGFICQCIDMLKPQPELTRRQNQKRKEKLQ